MKSSNINYILVKTNYILIKITILSKPIPFSISKNYMNRNALYFVAIPMNSTFINKNHASQLEA